MFPIVGVGASAGGLAATSELLKHLGREPGVALVVVHHLDPRHESSLADILSRSTEMSVHTARDGLKLEPNHVYVIPPNAGLLLNGGALVLTPRLEQGGIHLPIDQFFESLAAECGGCAVGVLLSGSGCDGTRGLLAIKQGGGITFVQDASAEHRAMPENALAAGCVDFVLPPSGIAEELARVATRADEMPLAPSANDSAQDDDPDLVRLLASLRRVSSVDLRHYKRGTIRRRAHRRMFLHRMSNLGEYVALLERDFAEAKALSEEVLIHVTSFFRDPETFESLKRSVLGELLLGRQPDNPIRVWVPGCSTGEEVYSLAIALLEFLADANALEIQLKLFGTDVSARAIDQARAGKYPQSIERDVSAARVERFFSRAGDSLQIRKDVRDLCVFAQHDITRDPPFSQMDLVSCRNLMIYFGAPLQDRILPILHYALRMPGFLVLGSSETTRSFPGFSNVDPKNKIYARTSSAPRWAFDYVGAGIRDARAPDAASAASGPTPLDVLKEADRLVLAEFAPAGLVISDDLGIVQFRGRVAQFLEPSPGMASLELMRMLKEELRLPVRRTVDEARVQQRAVRTAGVSMGFSPRRSTLTVEAIPFLIAPDQRRFFLVLFRDIVEEAARPAEPANEEAVASAEKHDVESELRRELGSTREYLQSVIEQMEANNQELLAANEEVVSSNEELRSTNEELQTAKEELQASNQELRTLNDEMRVRSFESGRLSDDLSNVLSSVATPIVILGRDAQIRRFTAPAIKLFKLLPSDIGRPISDIQSLIRLPELGQILAEVLEHLRPVERTVQDHEDRWYQLMVRPYMTLDNRIDGTLLVAFDVDRLKKAEVLLSEAREYAESIVDTVRECLVVVARDLRIRSANRAFCTSFEIEPSSVAGRHFHMLAEGELATPELMKHLIALGEGRSFENYRLSLQSGKVGERVLLLNGRKIEGTPWALVVLEDISVRERMERALHKNEVRFRNVLANAAEGVIMTDAGGQIVFANAMAARLFGYGLDEMNGLPIDALVPDEERTSHAEYRSSYRAAPTPRRMGGNRDVFGRRKDGTTMPIEVTLNVVPQEGDEPLVVSFVVDIMEKRAAEKRIAEYQEKLQSLAFERAAAEERERRRIATELHDNVGQALALAQIKLSTVRNALEDGPRAEADEVAKLIEKSALDTQTLTFELTPPVLYDLGLKEALAWLAERFEKEHGIRVELVDDERDKSLDQTTAALVFRAVRELLMNVIKHANSPTARVSLERKDDHIEIGVQDRGVGFESPPDAAAPKGFGLFSARQQIERLGGSFDLVSAPQQGTRVTMRIPLRRSESPGSEPPPELS